MSGIFAKWFISSRFTKSLAVLVFVAGMASMSLEFAASRILIPVFGSSIYTWGSLIGVILTGLSLGYHIGGKLADKNPSFLKLCLVIFSAGLYIIFIPFIAPTITSSFIQFVSDSQYASLFAVFTLLIAPTFLLGIVSPYAIKLATRRLAELGNVSGNLYSLSTIGSIVGTFLTVFILIPTFEINYIIFGLGVTLMFFSSLFGLARFPKILAVFVVLLLFFPSTSLSSAGNVMVHAGTLVYEKETLYSHLDVIDSGNIRTLYLDGNIHSQMYKDKPEELVNTYTKYFHLGFLFNPNAKDVLFVGGGGFSGPKNFLSTNSEARIDVVEIDPDVISTAHNYFDLPANNGSRLMVYNDDARNFLSKTEKKYDLIILDAFSKNYVPFHLMTLEYFQLLDEKLTSDGIIISNNIGSMTGDRSDIIRAVYKTISQVFPSVYVFPTEHNPGNLQNVMLATMKTPTEYNNDELRALASNNDDNNNHNSSIALDDLDYLKHLYEAEIQTDDVPLLTDQFAPVEILINPITNEPYNLENVPTKGSTALSWIEDANSIKLILLTTIAAIWIFYTQKEWKRNQKTMSL